VVVKLAYGRVDIFSFVIIGMSHPDNLFQARSWRVWWVRWNPSPVRWNQKELFKNNPKRQNWMQFWRWKCRKSFAALLWTLTGELTRVPTGQGKLGKVREFEWSGKSHGKWKIGATRCQIFRLKCIKFDFRWAQTPLGSLQHSPDPLAALNIAP